MSEISTKITERSFDDVIAEFDKAPETSPAFIPKEKEDHKVLDTPNGKTEKVEKTEPAAAATPAPVEAKVETPAPVADKKVEVKDIDSVLDRKDDQEEDDKDKEKKPISSLSQVLEELAKDEIIFPFDEDKPLSEYSAEDVKELLKANFEHQRKEALDTELGEFFESLPTEIQYAAKYVADGGTDLKALFKALAATEEIKTLDVKSLGDQESIIREYYKAIDWGNDTEISEELERVKELGKSEVEKLANKFKPKLEKMHDELVQQQLARQENARKLQEKEMEAYLANAHDAIKTGKIDDLQLDKKTQTTLWAGLVQPSYQTRRGASTNELGHLLEKYQYTEPNFGLMYKVLWLLKDEKGFEEAISKKKLNEGVNKTIRTLKTEQGQKVPTSTPATQEEGDSTSRKKKVIQRNTPNFMSGLKS